MPWILNQANKPERVALGSAEMLAARNTYMTEAEAKQAQQESCKHETLIGHRGAGWTQCADCGLAGINCR